MTVATVPATVPDLLGTAPADLIDQRAEQPVATRDVAVRRAERIRAGVASYAAMRQDIADAYAQRDWRALDYDSWHAYLEGEFGEELRALTVADRREAVRDLRDRGMTTRQIASATGVAQSTIRDDIKVSGIHSPEKVTGSDGKQHPGTKPRPVVTPTAAEEIARVVNAQPAPVAEPVLPGAATHVTPVQQVPVEPAAAVAAAIQQHLPVDPDDRFREWRRGFLADVGAAYRAISRNTALEVVERADDECVAELERAAVELTRFVEQVKRLRAASLPDNVVPIARS